MIGNSFDEIDEGLEISGTELNVGIREHVRYFMAVGEGKNYSFNFEDFAERAPNERDFGKVTEDLTYLEDEGFLERQEPDPTSKEPPRYSLTEEAVEYISGTLGISDDYEQSVRHVLSD